MFNNKKNGNKENEKAISTRQVSVIPSSEKNIFVNNLKTINILEEIIYAQDKFDAIQVIVSKTPDGKQALNVYLRLANQGIKVELYNATTGKRVKKYDGELREFTKNIGKNNSSGLDGLIDQLHYSAIARSGMAAEVVVNDDLTDIEEVLMIDPKTFTEFKWLEDKKRYAIYQNGRNGEKVDLYDGNFFWIPHQPRPGRPDGTLQFEPAIATMTQAYQFIQDSLRILNKIGYPRYLCEIDQEALLNSATPQQKSSPEQVSKLYTDTFNSVESQLRQIGKDSDIITFSSNKVSVLGGGVNGSGIDIRAWDEVLGNLIVNSFQLTPVLMGRLKSGSYSLGTAEYSIVCDTIDTMRRASKRMIEEIINLWARVKGYNVRCKVTHNPIDWQTELEKLDVELKKMEKARRAEEYRWISHDEAAQDGVGSEKASETAQTDMFEYLRKASNSSESTNTSKKDKEADEEAKNKIVNAALKEMGFEVY